jgi:hypothetical protein
MILPYGAVAPSTRTEHRGAEDNEGSALLGNEAVLKSGEGDANVVSSVSNLSNTIIGSGSSFSWSCARRVTDGLRSSGMLTFPLVSFQFPPHLNMYTHVAYFFSRLWRPRVSSQE